MKWIRNEHTEMNKSDTSDNKFYEQQRSMFDEDDDQLEERLSPNLSMDEVRSLLDEFEKILYIK